MRLIVIALAAALLAPSAVGQQEMSLEDYAALMESNRNATNEMESAVDAAEYDEARVHVAVLRRNFQELRRFWTVRERADAIGIVRDAIGRLAALEELLGRPQGVPEDLARETTGEFRGAACAACHDVYREGDRETGFRFREGVF